MTRPHLSRGRLFLLILVVFIIQGCRQDDQTSTATAIPTRLLQADTAVNESSNQPPATALPIPATVIPTATPTTTFPTATPPPQPTGQTTIGLSVHNQPLTAFRAGLGDKKVVFVGGEETADSWITQFQDNPDTVPAGQTLWFLPRPNPDNPDPNSPINANGINLFLNADSRFIGCPEQESNPEAGGPYPFSEPESMALRDFLADAWMVVLLTAEPNTMKPGGCGQHPPANALANLLASNSSISQNQAPLMNGHLADYLAGEGTAAVVIDQNGVNPAVITTILENFDQVVGTEAVASAGNLQWIDAENSGLWQFPTGTFIHPIALEIIGSYIYLLDSGQVQRLDQQTPAMPETILSPGDNVSGVRVIEPIDIAADGQNLFVLDRAGDVYAFDPATNIWSISRYDRPVGDTSTHYYVALAAQPGLIGQHFLLESSYHFALNQQAEGTDFIWPLPEFHQIDIAVNQSNTYILSQSPISPTASLIHYQAGVRDNDFLPGVGIHRPRQVQATGSLVYILDNGGRRLLALEQATCRLNTLYQPANGDRWSAFHVNQDNGRILLAAQDKLFFWGAPEEQAIIQGIGSHLLPQINDPQTLENLRGLLMPIGGSDIALRENQMPGAPRHYRLGIHEGADFYWQAGTPVRAVAAGTVIRATVDYQIPTQELFARWGFRVQELGYTSAEAHDFYRGMQVWIEHEGGLISRYVHLSAIDRLIQEGINVEAGQIIGAVGNTGSPVSLEGPNTDAHLHFELWLKDYYLGQFLRPIETREWLAIILNEQ